MIIGAAALSVAETVNGNVPFETEVGTGVGADAVAFVESSVGEGGADVPPGEERSDVSMADAGIVVTRENTVEKDGVAVGASVLLSVEDEGRAVALTEVIATDGTSLLRRCENED